MKKAAKDIRTIDGMGISHISSYGFRSMATTWEAVPENIKRRLTTDLAKLASRIKRKQHHKRTGNRSCCFMRCGRCKSTG
ncbi:MAG: hypothetical protein ACLRL6_03710 [Clostridium sp.]